MEAAFNHTTKAMNGEQRKYNVTLNKISVLSHHIERLQRKIKDTDTKIYSALISLHCLHWNVCEVHHIHRSISWLEFMLRERVATMLSNMGVERFGQYFPWREMGFTGMYAERKSEKTDQVNDDSEVWKVQVVLNYSLTLWICTWIVSPIVDETD